MGAKFLGYLFAVCAVVATGVYVQSSCAAEGRAQAQATFDRYQQAKVYEADGQRLEALLAAKREREAKGAEQSRVDSLTAAGPNLEAAKRYLSDKHGARFDADSLIIPPVEASNARNVRILTFSTDRGKHLYEMRAVLASGSWSFEIESETDAHTWNLYRGD